jgi:hypothetical protein
MRKKAKSFAVEEETYTQLSEIFKENYVEVSISYCINRYMKDLLEYFQSIKKELQQGESFTVPLAFIIENVARDTLFKKFDSKQSALEEIAKYQEIYNVYTKKHPEKANEYNTENINAELQFTKVVQWVLKVIWEERKPGGREQTGDEVTELALKIGGKEFLKGIRTRLIPITDKLDKYDPDLGEVFIRVINKVFKKKDGEK